MIRYSLFITIYWLSSIEIHIVEKQIGRLLIFGHHFISFIFYRTLVDIMAHFTLIDLNYQPDDRLSGFSLVDFHRCRALAFFYWSFSSPERHYSQLFLFFILFPALVYLIYISAFHWILSHLLHYEPASFSWLRLCYLSALPLTSPHMACRFWHSHNIAFLPLRLDWIFVWLNTVWSGCRRHEALLPKFIHDTTEYWHMMKFELFLFMDVSFSLSFHHESIYGHSTGHWPLSSCKLNTLSATYWSANWAWCHGCIRYIYAASCRILGNAFPDVALLTMRIPMHIIACSPFVLFPALSSLPSGITSAIPTLARLRFLLFDFLPDIIIDAWIYTLLVVISMLILEFRFHNSSKWFYQLIQRSSLIRLFSFEELSKELLRFMVRSWTYSGHYRWWIMITRICAIIYFVLVLNFHASLFLHCWFQSIVFDSLILSMLVNFFSMFSIFYWIAVFIDVSLPIFPPKFSSWLLFVNRYHASFSCSIYNSRRFSEAPNYRHHE